MFEGRLQSGRGLSEVYAALTRVPLFQGVRPEDIEMEPLGTLTNTSYRVTAAGEDYVLRLPGKSTWKYIDRVAEKHNGRIAAEAGINAEVVYFDATDGTMVSRFVEGITMDGERFRQHPEALVRAARLLRRVHDLDRVFEFRFNAFGMIGYYAELLSRAGMPLPTGYYRVEREAAAVRLALEAVPLPLVPSHNDPWPPNFIDAGRRMYLVDWEFSGMNDPFWDLGDFSVEAGLEPDQDRTMVETYWNGEPPPVLYSRLELYKAMSELLWSLWAHVAHANDNPVADLPAYARERFERCEARMSSPEFGRHLKAMREGGQLHFKRAWSRTEPQRQTARQSVRGSRPSRRVTEEPV